MPWRRSRRVRPSCWGTPRSWSGSSPREPRGPVRSLPPRWPRCTTVWASCRPPEDRRRDRACELARAQSTWRRGADEHRRGGPVTARPLRADDTSIHRPGSGPRTSPATAVLGVGVLVPEPWAQLLGEWRAKCGDPQASMVPPHVTLLPFFVVLVGVCLVFCVFL